MSVQEFVAGPASQSCRLIPFNDYVLLRSVPPILVVSGDAPCLNMEVSLQARIYVRCPEFWEIEVVGCLPGAICLDAIKSYTVSIPLDGIIGSEGIEIVGSNKQERIELGGGCRDEIHCNIAV